MSPIVTQADALQVMADFLSQAVPAVDEPAGFTFAGSDIPSGTTPAMKVYCRHIGGVGEGRTHDRPRVDVLVWADGTVRTQATALRMARILHGRARAALRTRDVASPVLLPDPANPAKRLALFTLELLTKGVQS
ncbi:hypothetical protein [Terrabacter terrigena]|uniref:DUF3168 domain-containing protein n=1 Tax=Terrabacter terrigena TaxID=574718 RepID=A0ABW3MXQ6_9MICO